MRVAPSGDYYELLGVSRSASEAEIQKAYRRLVREHHPDRNSGDPAAADRLKEINRAYSVLSDSEKRSRYDRFGEAGVQGGASGGAEWGFGGFTDIFDLFSGGRGRDPQAGDDLLARLEISLEDVETGAERIITVHRHETCDACSGRGSKTPAGRQPCAACAGSGVVRTARQSMLFGSVVQESTCYRCGGNGFIVTDPCSECAGAGRKKCGREIKVPIERGIDDGVRLLMRGEGEAGSNGSYGDLYIEIRVRRHPEFQRRGADLVAELDLSVAKAALGGAVKLNTLQGEKILTIPAGTQPGDMFRCRNLGLPRFRASGRGDLHVVARIAIPRQLNERQRAALLEFAQASGEDPAAEPAPKERGDGKLLEWVRNLFSAREDGS